MARRWESSTKILELGAGHGRVGQALHAQGANVVAVDLLKPDVDLPFPYLELDLDGEFAEETNEALNGKADTVVALDVIEHLQRPEGSLREIGRAMKPGGTLLASTGNVAYVLVRIMLRPGLLQLRKEGDPGSHAHPAFHHPLLLPNTRGRGL